MGETIHSRGVVVNGHSERRTRRTRGNLTALLLQACLLAVLVPIFASRDGDDPLRPMIVAFGLLALLVLRQLDVVASRRMTVRRPRPARAGDGEVAPLPRSLRPEHVVRLRSETFPDRRTRAAVGVRSTVRRGSDFA
jgi:hypothetical protein